jgi:hypothetical protein
MSSAMPPRVSGISAEASSAAGAAAEGSGRAIGGAVDSGTLVAVGTVAGTSPGSTSSPTPSTPSGSAKPQSSRSLAWSAARSGRFSVFITLTTSTRPSRSAAPTNVCRAASVNPVFPPIVPG